MQRRFEDMLDRVEELTRRLRGRIARMRERRPRLDGVRDRLRESDGWIVAARERVRPWYAVPALLSAAALIVGGFWLGGAVGGHASAAVLTRTVKVKGHVITIDGARFVSTPELTVKIKGKSVRIPASTVKLPASTVISGKTVPVKVDVNHTVSVPVTVSVPTTVNRTTVTTVFRTVTGPTTTVNGPTTTVVSTVLLPGSTITITAP
jgi:hypothetical protein